MAVRCPLPKLSLGPVAALYFALHCLHGIARDGICDRQQDVSRWRHEHSTMAGLYRGLTGGGGKQEVSYRSITNQCEHLAGYYLKAATEARAMAAMHRELAKAG